MNKEDFEKLIEALTKRVEACHLQLDNITTTEHIRQLTINEACKLKAFCKKEQSIMSKFVMSELYHIIGMGDLTTRQLPNLIKLVRDSTETTY